MSKLTTATVLAFERNLDISDGFMAQKIAKMKTVGLFLCVFKKSLSVAQSVIV